MSLPSLSNWWRLRRTPAAAALALPALCALLSPSVSYGGSTPNAGLSLRGTPKYKADFQAFDYVNPQAPKGGTLIIGQEGSVDTRNPFAVKGEVAAEVQQLVFQELGDASLDEPFTRYPSLAESFEEAPDHLGLYVRLRPEAHFSDGVQVTAEDVVFSLATFRSDKVLPFYKSYWADVKDVQVLNPHAVKFNFVKENPELALIVTELPILPKHIYEKGDFSATAIGSGPYVIDEFRPGAQLTLKRQADWWGKDLAVNRGSYNFDRMVIKYFQDPTALVETLKKGDVDMLAVYSAKSWVTDLQGERFDKLRYIKRELLPDRNTHGGQGWVFNLRRPLFQDLRVRQALALAFDFDWSNQNLFFGQYQQTASFFEGSPLAAVGLPTPEELKVLEPLKADLPTEVFTKEMGWLGKGQTIKERLRAAMALLKDAGYKVEDGVAKGPAGPLAFRFLLVSGSMSRVVEPYLQNLRKLGVTASLEEKELSVYSKRVDAREFDMISEIFSESQSPGNEQRDYWTTPAADAKFSRNYSGLMNKAVDALVEKVIYAKSRGELELYTRCLDRALYHLHLMVQNWYSPNFRLAYWDKFSHPAKLPDYYTPGSFYPRMWFDTTKVTKLNEAQAKGVPLP